MGWRKNNLDKTEVDFVLKRDNVIPIEVKASNKITSKHFSSVRTFLQETGEQVGFVVSLDELKINNINGKVIINLPAYLLHPDIIYGFVKSLT